jgi:hypothetical protein
MRLPVPLATSPLPLRLRLALPRLLLLRLLLLMMMPLLLMMQWMSCPPLTLAVLWLPWPRGLTTNAKLPPCRLRVAPRVRTPAQ